jgi:hypothetical protein
MRYGEYYKKLETALTGAGFQIIRQNSNHVHFQREGRPARPIVVSVKLNDGRFAAKLAKDAGVTIRALLVAAGLTVTARAEPPPDANPAYSPFYHSITTQDHVNSWCCSQQTDCREVQTRKEGGKWFVLATREIFKQNWLKPDEWIEVPDSAIAPNVREDVPRPASAVACVYNGELRCFTPPMMGG